jgi:hypothetical protein
MRLVLSEAMEACRTGGPPGGGPYGSFRAVCPVSGATLVIVSSDGRDWAEEGLPGRPWEHVSVSLRTRCPTWAEMCWVKDQFWTPYERAVQFHPARADHIDCHPFVLHIWRPADPEAACFPMPPKECV